MSKHLHLIVEDNVIFNCAETITKKLNEKYNTNYSVIDFYENKFQTVCGQDHDFEIIDCIKSLNVPDLWIREGAEDFLDTITELAENCKLTIEIESYAEAYRTETMEDVEKIRLFGDSVIYIGSDYRMCANYLADMVVLFTGDVEHQRNRVKGNEEDFYIIHNFQDLEALVKFYADYPELVGNPSSIIEE